MKLSKHGANLWQVTRWTAFNCYLVEEPDGLTLIDTGMKGMASGILKAAAEIGRPIVRITLTHAHGDHAGSLDELAASLPGIDVALSARTAAFLAGERSLAPDEPGEELRGSFIESGTRPTRLLTAGEKIGSLRVVAAPGHTPDQIAFFDERDGTLIAGDAFQTKAGLAVSGVMRWLFPFPAKATWHPPTALASARHLRGLQPVRLAVGHGQVLETPLERIDRALEEAAVKFREHISG